ncbi:hypothetical protein HRW18_18510 [Streptomyces lunaelactis]|uniref:hypothetical protein n=1 Tax=Streptomyces lunaelactis TaxID=1535768 RepID=UPI001585872C|nr:hypothetical protein [Streptomyces lunaelactis]NUK09958.1 hypothetical protein [Streptomyces lunaelactis]NUK72732.1 hypothetical protein [Streptomyces lunaelactis]NUL11422.1 hypothetical protein [Streptomyces lunaelactis]NUL25347.1 hypothetical protein [Streptomyces lunaelactis]
MSHPAGSTGLIVDRAFDLGWRARASARIVELQALADSVSDTLLSAADDRLLRRVLTHLAAARGAVARARITHLPEASTERVIAHLEAAEIALLQLAWAEMIRDALPDIVYRVRAQLSPGDPRRLAFDSMLRAAVRPGRGELNRDIIVAALQAANNAKLAELGRIRGFRAIVLVTDLCLLLIVGSIAVLGAVNPGALSFCFGAGDQAVCPIDRTPSAGDAAVIEAVGVCAAGLLGVRSVRAVPYSLLPVLLVAKLLSGAVFAVIGLFVMLGGFVPGLGGLDSRPQILAWAAVFGFASQILVRPLDQQLQQLVEGISKTASADEEGELVALLDERLALEGSVLSKRVSSVVSRTVEESLRGPELIAFSGAVKIVWQLDHGIPTAGEGETTLAPDGGYVLRVAISAGEPASSGWEELSVAGRDGEIVRFRLVAESDGLTINPGSREIAVHTSDGCEHADFGVHTPPHPGPNPVWISVYQYARLVQVLHVPVLVSAESVED